VNEKTGAIKSLRWKPHGIELVDPKLTVGLNQYLYVRGRDPQNSQGLSNVRVSLKEGGPLVMSFLVEADAPGARRYTSEIRLIAGVPRVDIITTIDKLPVREKEGVHIAFPFAVPGGILRYDVANGIVRAEADQLPGACKNFSSVQSWVDISNADFGVTVATPDAPLIEIGGINAELPWMTKLAPTQTFYSYVMNNYWHTNYKADQEGSVTFRYSILPHGPFRPEEAARFGREQREPLIAVPADNAGPALEPLLHIEPSSVLVHSVKPLAGGKSFLIYLYNPTASAQKVSLTWRGNARIALHRSDASGAALAPLADGFPLAAHGSMHVRVSLASAPK
jgi:alpha-mannosidase